MIKTSQAIQLRDIVVELITIFGLDGKKIVQFRYREFPWEPIQSSVIEENTDKLNFSISPGGPIMEQL